jgi:hypothetical protein
MSRLSAKLDETFPRLRATRRLRRMAAPNGGLAVFIERRSADIAPFRIVLRKDGKNVAIDCNLDAIRQHAHLAATFVRRPAVVIHVFARTRREIRTCCADFSDGYFSDAGIVSFSSNTTGAILIPDAEFYDKHGYADARALAETNRMPWRERADRVVWRGSSTGRGLIADSDMSPANPNLIQRTRMCLLLKGVAAADVRLVNAVQAKDPKGTLDALRRSGILGERIGPATWLGMKFAIDIDGNTNAWENLFTRLLFGCCVLKIGSPQGYRQWYYDDLIPWRHYVPVRPDMSDLMEKIDWCLSHGVECEAIADAGRQLAMQMTFERELARGTAILDQALTAD